MYLGASKDNVYGWINEKGMPGHRMGRLWKFKREEIDWWVTSGGASEEQDHGASGERA